MSINHVSLHLDISCQNDAGSVFSSPPAKLVVLRWECQENLVHMLKLVKMAHSLMADCGADTLVYDMRRLPSEEGLINDVVGRMQCVENKVVRHLAWLSSEPADRPLAADILAVVERHGVLACSGGTFEEIGLALDAARPGSDRAPIVGMKPVEFAATYAGSWYAMPELSATVLRTSGNTLDPNLSIEMFNAGFALHKKLNASSLIFDSSATPTILDLGRYIHVYQEFIVPMGISGLFRQAIHVRAGDPLFAEGAPPVGPLVTSFGVPFYEVELMDDAVELLRILKGKTRQVDTIRATPVEYK
jgi:hypothetical protein